MERPNLPISASNERGPAVELKGYHFTKISEFEGSRHDFGVKWGSKPQISSLPALLDDFQHRTSNRLGNVRGWLTI